MIIDLHRYLIHGGMNKTYINIFEVFGLPPQLRHLGSVSDYFEISVGPVNG